MIVDNRDPQHPDVLAIQKLVEKMKFGELQSWSAVWREFWELVGFVWFWFWLWELVGVRFWFWELVAVVWFKEFRC